MSEDVKKLIHIQFIIERQSLRSPKSVLFVAEKKKIFSLSQFVDSTKSCCVCGGKKWKTCVKSLTFIFSDRSIQILSDACVF